MTHNINASTGRKRHTGWAVAMTILVVAVIGVGGFDAYTMTHPHVTAPPSPRTTATPHASITALPALAPSATAAIGAHNVTVRETRFATSDGYSLNVSSGTITHATPCTTTHSDDVCYVGTIHTDTKDSPVFWSNDVVHSRLFADCTSLHRVSVPGAVVAADVRAHMSHLPYATVVMGSHDASGFIVVSPDGSRPSLSVVTDV